MRPHLWSSVDQVGIVVRSLDQALEAHGRWLSPREWRIWTYGPKLIPHQELRGERSSFEMRIALAGSSPQLELVEPVAGPSIYHEFLERRGEGIHHLASLVDSLDVALERMVGAGYVPLQMGRGYGLDDDGGFAYFDTEPELGYVLELIEVPRRRAEPEAVWPSMEVRGQ